MGDWRFMWKEEQDHEWDLVTYRIYYPNRAKAVKCIENTYRRRKDEDRIPKELLEERRVASHEVNGKPWKEGRIKPKPFKNGMRVTRQRNSSVRATPTARYKANKTERV
jgi:hypothetical protein